MKISQLFKASYHIIKANLNRNYRIPLSVYLFVTYRCPFKCKVCNIVSRVDWGNYNEMDTDTVIRLIDEMEEAGTIRIQLTGGEPLLRDDIADIIDYIKSKKIFVGISTSGYNIPKLIKHLNNTDIIFLSYQGPENSQRFSRDDETHRVFIESLKTLKKSSIKFWITTVINRQDKTVIDDIIRLSEKYNIKSNYQMLHTTGEKYNPVSDFKNKQVISYILRRKKEGAPVGTSSEYLKFLLNWKNYSHDTSFIDGYNCMAGRLYCHVTPSGDVLPCGIDVNKKGVSALKYGFKNAFNQLEQYKCNTCLSACHMEQNFIFSMKISAGFNWLKNM